MVEYIRAAFFITVDEEGMHRRFRLSPVNNQFALDLIETRPGPLRRQLKKTKVMKRTFFPEFIPALIHLKKSFLQVFEDGFIPV